VLQKAVSNPASATGNPFTVIVCVIVSEPKLLVAINMTLYVPGVVHNTDGFCTVLVAGFPPANVQLHAVGAGEERSVKCAESIAHAVDTLYNALGVVVAVPEMLMLSR